jgi:FAD/FMN-containing dehydrogenase
MTDLIDKLKAIVGPAGWKSDASELAPFLTDWRDVYVGKALLMVAPASTAETAAVVRECGSAGVAIVPQGGNTGLCGGSVPDTSGDQVLLSMSRMNKIRQVDALNSSIEVEAGCVLAAIQEAARNAGLVFPLSLGAEGSCQIGGNLATNAGGINVIRYGNAGSLVLGLEVVLADGSVLSSLRSLRKDAAGYDLKQLFIGSEGTLGIITAASLKLVPDPGDMTTALIALNDSDDAVRLLGAMRESLGDGIEAFELVSGPVFRLVEQFIPGARLPFAESHPWYVLTQAATQGRQDAMAAALTSDACADLFADAVIAKNSTEADNLWHLRHSTAEAERQHGKHLKHDISVPVSRISEFLVRGDELIRQLSPDARLLAFGHVGDGNLHYNVDLTSVTSARDSAALGESISAAIYDLVAELGGSFSAEHGVGVAKKHLLEQYRSGVELALMRRLKHALDPQNILNPGKVI